MKYIVPVLFLVAFAWGDDATLDKFPKLFDVDEITSAIKEECDTNGGKGTYDKLVTAINDMTAFIQTNFDQKQIAQEVEDSSKTGELDDVIKKYCQLRSKSLEKVHKLIDAGINCVVEEDRSSIKLAANITESLMTFACDKDGERVALFVAEDGFACLSEKSSELEKCAEGAVGDKIQKNKIPKLSIQKQECDEVKEFQACVVKSMSSCKKDMPSEIIDALFNHIYSLSPCPNLA
ncbi:27 kDa hemolymph protein-like [Photinus pyralis]|nr:27 kDa hemolymph protein-like [Photinus pyralis]